MQDSAFHVNVERLEDAAWVIPVLLGRVGLTSTWHWRLFNRSTKIYFNTSDYCFSTSGLLCVWWQISLSDAEQQSSEFWDMRQGVRKTYYFGFFSPNVFYLIHRSVTHYHHLRSSSELCLEAFTVWFGLVRWSWELGAELSFSESESCKSAGNLLSNLASKSDPCVLD